MGQAGTITIARIRGQQLTQVLNTTWPGMLFPYGREVIDSTLVKGSFPPLMIPPINFDALFVQAMQQSQAKAEQVAAEEPSEGTTH